MKNLIGAILNLAMVVAFTSGIIAQPGAKEVVRLSDEKMRGITTQGQFSVLIVRPGWQREIQMRSWTKGNAFAMIYVQSPVRDQGTVFLKRQKEVWNWLPSIERSVKLPPSMMSQSWMGTDFTNDDLVKEFSILEDYTHEFKGEEIIDSRPCYIIELMPKPQAAVVWGKIRMWVDKKDYMQLRAAFYDEGGRLVNVMNGSDIKVLGGKLLPAKMEMVPVDKPGNKTIMIYRQLIFDEPIPDAFFSVENMKKVK